MIEPVSDALTTSVSPACSAKNAMISSAMLPNVALRMPPTCGPVSEPSRSVDSPTTQASPRIDAADRTNSRVASTCSPKSRTIVSRLSPTVTSSETRASVDSWPRMGRPGLRVAGLGDAPSAKFQGRLPIDACARLDACGPSDQKGHPQRFFVHETLVEQPVVAQEEPLVARVDHQGVPREPAPVEDVEKTADVVVD